MDKPINKLIEKFEEELKTEFKDRFSELKELKNKSESDEKIFLMGLITQFFINHKEIINEEIVETLLEYDNPLEDLAGIFVDYVYLDNLFFEVFEDAVLNDFENIDEFRSQFYYEDEDFEEDNDGDGEGFIHDNEDC